MKNSYGLAPHHNYYSNISETAELKIKSGIESKLYTFVAKFYPVK